MSTMMVMQLCMMVMQLKFMGAVKIFRYTERNFVSWMHSFSTRLFSVGIVFEAYNL